jgi:hypothetical protein
MATNPEPQPELAPVPPGIRRSQEAYWRDLPELLKIKKRGRWWVAYHGDERVGFARSQAELYQECCRRGFKGDEIYLGRVEPHTEAPWEEIEIESFGEGPDDDPGFPTGQSP